MWKKILAGLLILAGLVLIFSNQINEQVMKYQSQRITKEVNEISPEEIKQNNEQVLSPELEEGIYDFSQVREAGLDETWVSLFERSKGDALFQEYLAGAVESGSIASPPTEEEAKEALKKFNRKFYIGVLKIPKINLELGILRGVRNNNLWTGAGTMRPDQVMGEGNYPLAGHHMRAWEVLFNRVPELRKGDLIYVTDKENIYTYRVYQNRKVHESEVSVIYEQVATQHGSPVLTLVTCFHRDEPEARVIIHGELIDVQPFSNAAFQGL